jgi:hypothetical protein
MTHGEKEDLAGLRQEAQSTLDHLEKNPGTSRSDMIDKARLKKEIAYYDGQIAAGTPQAFRGMNKDKMVARAKELADKMQVNMPTREQMDHPARNPGAVRKHMIWTKNNDGNIREYKELQRRLEPDDPTATDVEKLRKEK